MRVLGISGRRRDGAAAIAVDGQVVAAASEDSFARVPNIGYGYTGGFPRAAVDACLATAGLPASAIDAVTVVDDDGVDEASIQEIFGTAPIRPIAAIDADAVQAAASAQTEGGVFVCSPDRAAMGVFSRTAGGLRQVDRDTSAGDLIRAARAIAAAVGVSEPDACAGLDRLSRGAEPEFAGQMTGAIGWREGTGVVVDATRLATFLDSFNGALSSAAPVNVRAQNTRRAIAASFTCRVAEVLRDACDGVKSRSDEPLVVGGQMFANPQLNTHFRKLVGDDVFQAAVPEAAGRALGAALAASAIAPEGLHDIALGPAFSDSEIKRTLDGCRLEYVFEPDRQRVLKRVSKMLSQGKVVAWFHGPMAFGPRPMGTRSILCDPSTRYARHNVNEYLRQVALDEPLPLVFAPSVATECLASAAASPFVVLDAAVNSAWHGRLGGALDWRKNVRVHAPRSRYAPELCELLEHHYATTGVPALIETNLSGPGESVACTPRDAVRTVYSSAIDALIIGRFILMKDYWLLQTNAD